MTPLTALAAFVSRQHHVISTAQLRSLGWSDKGLASLVRSEHLFRLYRGVYAFGRREVSRQGRWLGAVLACPRGAVLSHLSAAVLWELLEHESRWPHVLVPATATSRARRGIVLHRSVDLDEQHRVRRDAIPVTSVLRTLVDLSRTRIADPSLDRAVRQAGRLHDADLQQLSGLPRLGKLVRRYDPLIAMTESDLEAAFLGMCARHRLPTPAPQWRFGRYRADFAWPSHRLAVECQSRRWHANDVNFVTDRQKLRAIEDAGYRLLPFAWAEIVHSPADVAREIRAALRRQEQLLGGRPL